MKKRLSPAMRISGIEVAKDRYVSINGPALTRLPSWGLRVASDEVEYQLHPMIDFELHYKVPVYVLVHYFSGAEGRCSVGEGSMAPWVADARSTSLVPIDTRVRVEHPLPLEFIGLGIAPDRIARVAASLGIAWDHGASEFYHTSDPALAAICAEMRRGMIAEPVALQDYLDSLTDALLTRLLTAHLAVSPEVPAGPEALSPAMVRRLAARIEEQIGSPIRIAALAEEAGLSRSHFSRAFAHSFGMPARNYVMSRRIARARSLLVESERAVTEIALACGFASPSHLSTAFRSEMGLSPKAYRQAFEQRKG